MANENVRIGIIGAGYIARQRHLPGFQAIEGASVIGVCNRSRQSSEAAAAEFEIPRVYDDWMEMVRDEDLNAICIGTWPYMHKTMVLAALENGKHVLTEARMAMNAQEAHEMLDASRRHPDLVTQIVPSPVTLKVDRAIQDLVADGYLGDVLAIDLQSFQSNFVDSDSPLHWRQDVEVSGFNTLNSGIWYEALMRWVGPASKVTAMAKVNVNQRRDGNGLLRSVSVPDHLDILCEMACGAHARLSFSAVTGLSPGTEVWLYGSDGTLRLEGGSLALYGGRRGEEQLSEISIPQEKLGDWRVERDFIDAIRGENKVTLTPFEEGVRYMEFTEAVVRSYMTGQAISLPLV